MKAGEEQHTEPSPWVASGLPFFLHLFSFPVGDRRSPLDLYPLLVTARNRPILIRLSAITHRCRQVLPRSPHHRQRFSPWRRFGTLMRPSVRFATFSPLRKDRSLLMSSSFGTLRGAVRNRDLPHAHVLQLGLVTRRVERRVTGHQCGTRRIALMLSLPAPADPPSLGRF